MCPCASREEARLVSKSAHQDVSADPAAQGNQRQPRPTYPEDAQIVTWVPAVLEGGVGPSELADMVRKGPSESASFGPQNGILGVGKGDLSETSRREEASLVRPRRTG